MEAQCIGKVEQQHECTRSSNGGETDFAARVVKFCPSCPPAVAVMEKVCKENKRCEPQEKEYELADEEASGT